MRAVNNGPVFLYGNEIHESAMSVLNSTFILSSEIQWACLFEYKLYFIKGFL